MADDIRAIETEIQAIVAERKTTAEEVSRVANKETITDKDQAYLDELEEKFDQLGAKERELYRKRLVAKVQNGTANVEKVADLDDDPIGEPRSIKDGARFRDPWNLSEMLHRAKFADDPSAVEGELRARALDAIEKMSGTNDRRREVMTRLVEEHPRLARQLLVTSSPDYLRGWTKMAMNPNARLTEAEARAMSLTDTAGGFLVPFQLDPAVIITSDGSRNQIRQAARQVIATGDVWNGVSSAAVSWSWDAEAAQVSDDATTFAQPSITVHKGAGFVPISLEAIADEANVASEVGRLLAFGKDTLEATAFATGSGSGQPFGIVTALNGSAPPVVAATTNNAFGLPDVYALDNALPARYRANGSWLANRAIYNRVRQFDTAGGAALWVRLADDVPARLLDRPAYEAEAMDGALATGNDYVLVFGDFEHFIVADRIGTTVEFIPHLFGANQRPTGQRGWYAYFRAGADSVNDSAFKLLRV